MGRYFWYDMGVEIEANGVNTGTVIPGPNVASHLLYGAGTGTIKLQGVDVTNANLALFSTGIVGVQISQANGASLSQKTIDTGNISLAGTSSQLMAGFYHGAMPTAVFDGVLKVGDVNVANNDNTSTGPTYGVAFRGGLSSADISGNVTTGNIKVKSFNATGFSAKNLINGAEVTLGNVDVTVGTSNFWWPNGVAVSQIGDGLANGTEKLTVGNVNVTSDSVLNVTGIAFTAINNDGVVEAKDVTVKSSVAGVNATGVWVGNNGQCFQGVI
jgi:hypothetical protein